ncbi:TPA: hypothetical protein I0F89_RS00660 [Enterococcus faecalis]|nr:hypothetical protein [Enterococcus faecalis]HBI1736667.1 hypothetical protein [Enterococcus faecalis]HBI1739404.1 hypothetical protein [Enterococcus faecalis]HBI1742263.1 hypothetical protein [Enterococcus faecalis]HBI1745601.1 hypothetical protein [Enterococcus faecalis]
MENEKMIELENQIDLFAKNVLDDVKSSCVTFGEVRRTLLKKMDVAKWKNDMIFSEVISRSIKLVEEEIDTIEC